MQVLRQIALATGFWMLVGCSNNKVPDAPVAAPVVSSAEAVVVPSAPAVSSQVEAPAASSAAAPAQGSQSDAAPQASSSAAVAPAPSQEPPLPEVTVVNIGMHIGGGPNDAATKEPIKLSVEPHFDALRRCYGLVEVQGAGDFGVDLKIGKDGGKARVNAPRTAMKGAKFKECVVKVFESIEFRKPRGGATVVSYSLRFTPGAKH